MDKSTLSNYGWVVIAVLVLSVMIALATPFGKFVSNAVQSTTQGLFGVNQNALGAVNITIADQEFDVPDGNGGTEETPAPVIGSATFTDGITLSWAELKDSSNGTKYGYDASAISDTTIGEDAFRSVTTLESITLPDSVTTIGGYAFSTCKSLKSISFEKNSQLATIGEGAFAPCTSLESITLPDSVTTIGSHVFSWCTSLESITFEGTIVQWNAITKDGIWNFGVPATKVFCSDGEVIL